MSPVDTKIRVSTPARLHLGFLDLNGSTGRKFGSIGLAVNSHHTIIEAQLAASTSINTPNADPEIQQRVGKLIAKFYATLGQHIAADQRGVTISLVQLIPEHAGLGSGTQLALAVGSALGKLHQLPASTSDIAAQLGRGSRSGIGIATFDHGGFIVDGGLSDTSPVPPLLAHYKFPENWRMVIIMEHHNKGLHGSQELSAFNTLDTFPLSNSQAICHLTLMKLLPALLEKNIEQFGQAITEIQTLIGDHFAPVQGGRYTSKDIAILLNHAKSLGHAGIAQSSWGPTGCVFVENDQSAKQLINDLGNYADNNIKANSELAFTIAQASSNGANIEIVPT